MPKLTEARRGTTAVTGYRRWRRSADRATGRPFWARKKTKGGMVNSEGRVISRAKDPWAAARNSEGIFSRGTLQMPARR